MRILLHSDFLNEYFEINGKPFKSELDILRSNIIQNNKKKILLNKNYLWYLDSIFHSTHTLYDQYTIFMYHLLDDDTKHLKLSDCPTSTNINDEFIFLSSLLDSDLLISISEQPIIGARNHAVFNQIAKPNKDWQVCELAGNNMVKVTYKDFSTNNEVVQYLNNFFTLPINGCDFFYFDPFASNTPNHLCFQGIQNRGFPLSIFTWGRDHSTRQLLNSQGLQYLKIMFRQHFGATTKVYYTADRKDIHERKFLFNNIVLESTHDFEQLKTNHPTWTLYVNYSPEDYQDWLQKIGLFTEIP